MTTATLYNVIHSELIKSGFNEVVDYNGKLVYFDDNNQFMTKMLKYDDDVAEIVDTLFLNQSLKNPVHDQHFKQSFMTRFLNRQINAQTIDSFKMLLISTFKTYESHLNTVYDELDKFIKQESISERESNSAASDTSNSQSNQNNTQETQSETTTNNTSDTRSAQAELPQNNVQIDLNDTTMNSADRTDMNRTKQDNLSTGKDNTSGNTSSQTESNTQSNVTSNDSNQSYMYRLDELFKSRHVFDVILKEFDSRCFLQFW